MVAYEEQEIESIAKEPDGLADAVRGCVLECEAVVRGWSC